MPLLILTSFAKKTDALGFAKKLLGQKLAACCSIFPGATSLYHWKGKDVKASEVFLLIKTVSQKMKPLEKFFKENHPYELPEFLTMKVSASKGFGAWIKKQV